MPYRSETLLLIVCQHFMLEAQGINSTRQRIDFRA